MRMTLYETVKSNVTTLQAAERYGLKVGHGGMCKCPFHNDKNPSMKVDKRFHCFGCQADGDVITFTGRLFNITPKEAALKLADDFFIRYDMHDHIGSTECGDGYHSVHTVREGWHVLFGRRASYYGLFHGDNSGFDRGPLPFLLIGGVQLAYTEIRDKSGEYPELF